MFRHRKRIQREKKKWKKKNCNKRAKKKIHRDGMSNGPDKAIQMRLREEGIRVHKMDLRSIRVIIPRLYDPESEVGNSTQQIVKERYEHYSRELRDDVESTMVHDMTRWKANKKKTKERNRQRRSKQTRNGGLI